MLPRSKRVRRAGGCTLRQRRLQLRNNLNNNKLLRTEISAKQPTTAIALSLLLMNRFHRANQPSSLALLRMPIGGCPSPAHAHLLHPRAAAPRCPDLTRVPQQTYSCCCERRRMK